MSSMAALLGYKQKKNWSDEDVPDVPSLETHAVASGSNKCNNTNASGSAQSFFSGYQARLDAIKSPVTAGKPQAAKSWKSNSQNRPVHSKEEASALEVRSMRKREEVKLPECVSAMKVAEFSQGSTYKCFLASPREFVVESNQVQACEGLQYLKKGEKVGLAVARGMELKVCHTLVKVHIIIRIMFIMLIFLPFLEERRQVLVFGHRSLLKYVLSCRRIKLATPLSKVNEKTFSW